MEHPDLSPDASAGQDVGVVVPELERGPGEGVEIFFDVFVFVFHQHGAAVHVDDADGVTATRGHQAGGLGGVLRIRLKHNLKWSKLLEKESMGPNQGELEGGPN